MSPPFLPFTRPDIDPSTIDDVVKVLRSGKLTGGPQVVAFEEALSAYCGGRSVRTFNSGTSALSTALRLLDVGPGDEVITTPLSWVATANVILGVGARPVFVDVDPDTRNIDIDLIEGNITDRTRALMPVDLAGLPVERDRLYDVASRFRLRVIEDAAQSLGSRWRGTPIGAVGDMVAFSFHANKNITTGEGGALVLPEGADISLCERLRSHGVRRGAQGECDVDVLGTKSNLTDIAAAIGVGQLVRLDQLTRIRHCLAKIYFENIRRDMGLSLPVEDFSHTNWHMFQIVLPPGLDRSAFITEMSAKGIGVGVHYPAIHLFTLYRALGYRSGDFPVAEDIACRIITLPLFASLCESDVLRVCEAVNETVHALAHQT